MINFKCKHGFSLIELVVVMGILVIIFGVAVTVFSQVIRTANRAHIANVVRSEAAFALSEMVRDLQEAERVTISGSSIRLEDSEGNCYLSYGLWDLTCDSVARDNDCSGGWDDQLTSDTVRVTALSFSQNESRVDVRIEVEQCSTLTRPEFRGSIELREGVNLRNYAGYQ